MIRVAIGLLGGLALGVVLAAMLSLSGCDEIDNGGWRIERTRILGVRVEAEGDPSRAWLAPGENGSLTWLVTSPEGAREVAWTMATCIKDNVLLGEPQCKGPTLASSSGRVTAEQVVVPITMPGEDQLAGTEELLVLALFCPSGEPALDAVKFEGECVGGSDVSTLASFEVRVARDGLTNHNPTLDDDAFRLDGVPTAPEPLALPPASAAAVGPGCEPGPDLPLVIAGTEERVLRARLREDAREPLPPPDEGLERLQLSHFTTGGKLERQVSLLEPGAPAGDLTVGWTPPPVEEVGEGGRLVRFHFTLRDQRGGLAFATRAVCVRRP